MRHKKGRNSDVDARPCPILGDRWDKWNELAEVQCVAQG